MAVGSGAPKQVTNGFGWDLIFESGVSAAGKYIHAGQLLVSSNDFVQRFWPRALSEGI